MTSAHKEVPEVLAAFEQHLLVEKGRSANTARAYLADLRSLVDHLQEQDGAAVALADVRLADLRSWLGAQGDAGATRSTVSRRAAAARTFFRWAARIARDYSQGLETGRIGLALRTQHAVADKLVYGKLRAADGRTRSIAQ